MSWADDIRCLYCDGRLPLYRKITNGQFCSAAHRKAYWQEQERLAVERLHQTHDSLRAHQPRVPVEAILGKTDPEPFEQNEERPVWLVQANTGDVGIAGFMRESALIHPRWLADRIVLSEPGPILAALAPRSAFAVFAPAPVVFGQAKRIAIPLFPLRTARLAVRAPGVTPAAFTIVAVRDVAWLSAPLSEPVETIEAPAPLCVALFALSRGAPAALVLRIAGNPVPLDLAFRAQLPLFAKLAVPVLAEPGLKIKEAASGLLELPVALGIATAPPADGLRALDLRAAVESPELHLETPPLRPRLRLASGRRYAVESCAAPAACSASAGAVEPSTLSVSLPQRTPQVLRAATASTTPARPAADAFEPAAAGLLSLDCTAHAAEARSVRPSLSVPQPPRSEPVRPASKLEPVADFMATPPRSFDPIDPKRANVWMLGVDFWNRAPRDLKMLALAIPVLLALALHPALPKVRVSASSSGIGRNVQSAVNTQWTNIKQTVFDRAAVALDEDFRSGLDDWASRGDSTTDWSFDETGFVRPGPLALYRPSMGLNDYQLQFLGMIDRKALSWVVRAADFDNYYVIKLEVLKPGPLPTLGLTRYAVVNGKADSRADVAVPLDARNDTLYRVLFDVHGDDFSLSIQGQVIDAWSEPRLAHGGVGFFTADGEQSRLRWVQVTHQYDMLGRLCAYLAPYNIPPETGSLQRQ